MNVTEFHPPPDAAGGGIHYPVYMKTIRLLIVDDLAEVREGLASLLRLAFMQRGQAVEIVGDASNGEEALQEAARLHPDVVLMDLEMPVMDGYAATRQMKADQLAQRIIILSIHAGAEERELARRAGANAFLVKGGRLEGLLNAILNEGEPINSEKGEME